MKKIEVETDRLCPDCFNKYEEIEHLIYYEESKNGEIIEKGLFCRKCGYKEVIWKKEGIIELIVKHLDRIGYIILMTSPFFWFVVGEFWVFIALLGLFLFTCVEEDKRR